MKGMLRAIAGAQFWQGISLLCVTATQLAIARWLGPTALGVTAMIVSGASFCTLISEANLQSALVRSISGAGAEARILLARDTLLGRLVVVALLIPIVGIPFAVFAEHSRTIILAGIASLALAQIMNPSWWLQGLDRASAGFQLSGAVALLALILSLLVLYWLRIPGAEAIATGLGGFCVYAIYWARTAREWRYTGQIRIALLSYVKFAAANRHFVIGGVAIYLYLYSSSTVLAYTRSSEEAGIFRFAVLPGTAVYALCVAAFYAYFPKVVRAFKAQNDRPVLLQAGVCVLGGVVAAWGVLIVARPVIIGIVGDQFIPSLEVAPALVLSKGIGGIGLVARAALLTRGRERAAFQTFFWIGIGGFAASCVIIPRFGLIGAAMLELVQELLHFVILIFQLRERPHLGAKRIL